MHIKNTFKKVKSFTVSHKILSIIILIVLVSSPIVIYNFIPKGKNTSYITQIAKKGNISVSVSGTGQVSSLKEVNITTKVSGDIIGVYAKNGESVNRGDLLFKIDDKDGIKGVKTAELALESSELSLEKMLAPTDELTLLQSENSLIQAQNSKQTAENNLEKSYDDGFNDVSNSFLDLPGIMLGLNNVLFSTTISGAANNIYYYSDSTRGYDPKILTYGNDLFDAYIETKKIYDQNFTDYKNITIYSSKEDIEKLIEETYDTVKKISDTIKASNDYIQYYKEILNNLSMTPTPYADTHLSTLNGYTSKVNGHLSTLLSAGTTITNYKDSIISSDRTIREKELSLEDTKEGADDIDIRTQELVVDQKKEDLRQAQETLAEYSIRAPFSGIMASVDIVSGDAVNSGATIGSIVTNDKIANITLNEVDIAKVKLGQKVDITFDALDDLLVEGEVAEIDTLGTVSQGVVSYNVKISFDTKDERVKPGMSITANIIVDSVEDVITISSGAIKTIGKASFVEVMLEDGKTERKKVETGISDDVMIEIKSGINEGDKIVTQTIAGTVKKNTTSKSTVPGGGQEMNNIMRITR